MLSSLQVLIGFVAIALMALGAQAQEKSFERFMLDLMEPMILNNEYADTDKKMIYRTK